MSAPDDVRRLIPAAIDRAYASPVHVSFGWLPVGEYAVQMLVDLTVHEWDLARGAGLDEQVDPECAAEALA